MTGPNKEAAQKLQDDLTGRFKGSTLNDVLNSKVAIEIACRKNLWQAMNAEEIQYTAQILFTELTQVANTENGLTDQAITDVLQKVIGGDIQNRPLIEARAEKIVDLGEIEVYSQKAMKNPAMTVEDDEGVVYGEIAAKEGGDLIVALEDQRFMIKFEDIWNGLMVSLDRTELITKKNGHDS